MTVSEKKLEEYIIDIEQPVVVFGDASPSMDVAIRTSTIIASILCKICNAKMHLFGTDDELIEKPPRSVNDAIKMGIECKTRGLTSPVASLYPYLKRKEIVKTFILVTDEIENTDYDGKWFDDLADPKGFSAIFKEYRNTVYKSKIVFVSFVPDRRDGKMVKQLKKDIPGIEKDIIQFRLNSDKPDLRKLDLLLNTLEMESDIYNNICKYTHNKIKNIGENKICKCNEIINNYIIANLDHQTVTI